MKRRPLVATNVTETVEGPIPHLELFTDFGLVLCPVCLAMTPRTDGRLVLVSKIAGGAWLPSPRRREGRLVYALPGGGEYVA